MGCACGKRQRPVVTSVQAMQEAQEARDAQAQSLEAAIAAAAAPAAWGEATVDGGSGAAVPAGGQPE